jgi:tellurite resistance protein TehA-like permease
MLPFLRGFTMFFWATGTWWLPRLVILGWWRHVWRAFQLTYDPLYWGIVFPLGMYTVSTFQLANAIAAIRGLGAAYFRLYCAVRLGGDFHRSLANDIPAAAAQG